MSTHHNSRRFGLIGKRLNHSFSKQYFTTKFQNFDFPDSYDNFEIETIEDLTNLLNNNILSGFNVTIPFKESILPFLDELSPEAKSIAAVNTVVVHEGKLIGHNTDAFGFHQMIKPFLLNTHERALILGNGGASKSVIYVLKSIGLEVLVAARHPKSNEFHLHEVNEIMIKHCGIIVNTTPVGTAPHFDVCLDLPYSAITTEHLVVDLIYNPEQTLYLKKAKEQGAVTLNGLTMLHQQAEKSWEIWNLKA